MRSGYVSWLSFCHGIQLACHQRDAWGSFAPVLARFFLAGHRPSGNDGGSWTQLESGKISVPPGKLTVCY